MSLIKDRALNDVEERRAFICDCHSLEHQFVLWYDEELNNIYIEPHLYHSGNWFKRLWGGVKYIFGYKSRFGNWDETIIKNEDIPNIRKYFDIVEKEDKKRLDKLIDEALNLVVNRGFY